MPENRVDVFMKCAVKTEKFLYTVHKSAENKAFRAGTGSTTKSPSAN